MCSRTKALPMVSFTCRLKPVNRGKQPVFSAAGKAHSSI